MDDELRELAYSAVADLPLHIFDDLKSGAMREFMEHLVVSLQDIICSLDAINRTLRGDGE